jgi:hypothetical protein
MMITENVEVDIVTEMIETKIEIGTAGTDVIEELRTGTVGYEMVTKR